MTLDLPLPGLHPLAYKASEATHCAEEQGKFWEMHDRLFEHQKALEPWSGHAEALGLDVPAFDECMSTDRYKDAVAKDIAEANRAGATGTPSFVLGLTNPDDPKSVKGLTFIRGAQPFERFKSTIDQALAEANE